jgi:hypothetical protein
VEVPRAGEVLTDQLGADDPTVAHDQAAAGLVRKEQVGQSGDRQWIDEPGEHGQHDH